MLDHVTLAASALVAGLVLLLATSVADASTIVIAPTRVRAVWSSLSFTTSSTTIRCPITLEASFHSSTFAPIEGLQVGYVTRAAATEAGCNGGRVTMLAETLPWRIRFESAAGSLPEISGVHLKLIGFAVRGEASGITCRYQSSDSNPSRGTLEVRPQTVEATGLRTDESAAVPVITEEFFCRLGGSSRASGTARVTESGSTRGIELGVVNDDVLLSFDPDGLISLDRSIFRDVTIEAPRDRTLGTLSVRGQDSGQFDVSEGCDRRAVGPTARPTFCMVTVSYTGVALNRFAWVKVPVDGLARFLYISYP